MTQAKQPAMGGGWEYRWYVMLEGGKRVATWAPTIESAKAKAVAKGRKVVAVWEAPSLLDEQEGKD